MADVNRLEIKYFVNHHAVTPAWDDKSKKWIAQWFSDNGFSRGYGGNSKNWSGLYNPYTGAKSYAQAHCVGQRVTAATPDATSAEKKAGYRVFPVVKDPWGQITWGAGNWNVNRAAINIEHLGDYRTMNFRDNDIRVIANFWRPHDQKRKGSTRIVGHNEVSDTGTACPANIKKSLATMVKYINNPPKDVVVTTKEVTDVTNIDFARTTVEDPSLLEGTTKVVQKGVAGKRTIVYTVTYTDGKETKRVTKSDTTIKPVDEIVAVGTYVKPVNPLDPEDGQNAANWLQKMWDWIKEQLKKVTFKG